MFLEFVLLLILCVILKFMFNTFGFLPDKDEKRKDEAISNFVSKISNDNNSANSVKNTININKKEKGFFASIQESYENYKNKLKNNDNRANNVNNDNVFNLNNKVEKVEEENKETKQINNFEEEIFKKTAEKAVVVILDAFTKKNFLALKDMLTENMYDIFSKNIKEAEEKKYNYKTVIISFDEVNIVEKNISTNEKSIKLNLKMKQVNYVEDENENVVAGSKDKVNAVVENWTFIKNPSSNFWLLKSIN